MKLIVSHVYSSDNKGDAAILASQLTELHRVFPQATLEVLTLDQVSPGQTFEGVPIRNSLMYYVYYSGLSKLPKFLHTLAMTSYTLLWAALYRGAHISLPLPRAWQEVVRTMVEANAQVAVGGGYLRGKQNIVSTVTLWLMVHQVLFMQLLGKPTVLYAQSVGPFYGPVQRALARFMLARVALILTREGTSTALLAQLKVSARRVHEVPDTAFLFKSQRPQGVRALMPDISPPRIVGVTVRQWLAPAAQRAYEEAVAGLLRHIASRGWGVMIIPQVTADAHNDDDRLVGRRLKAVLPESLIVNIEEKLDHHQIKSLYSDLDLLVGTRFHSVIFALSEGIPALAVEYEHKTSGILRALGLERFCVPITDVTGSDLIVRFQALVDAEQDVRNHLAVVMPPYQAQARRGAELIHNVLYNILAAQDIPSQLPGSLEPDS